MALGDSYTIGTSVTAADRWPSLLVERLRGTVDLELVANLGVNGFTSSDLIEAELPRLVRLMPAFARWMDLIAPAVVEAFSAPRQ